MKEADRAAYRARAGMIGALQSCLCRYPLERYRTKTGHENGCPAAVILASAEAAVLEVSKRAAR